MDRRMALRWIPWNREDDRVPGGTCFASPPEIEGEIGNDPHEPAAKCLGLLQHWQIGEGLEEGILGNFHRVVDITEEPICDGDGRALISEKKFVESRAIAVAGLADEMAVAKAPFFRPGFGKADLESP